jgi:hypothetical protein
MSGLENAEAGVASAPALIGLDEFRLDIPWPDALQQGLPPLQQPGAMRSEFSSPVEDFAANGKPSLNCLSHPRGKRNVIFISTSINAGLDGIVNWHVAS